MPRLLLLQPPLLTQGVLEDKKKKCKKKIKLKIGGLKQGEKKNSRPLLK